MNKTDCQKIKCEDYMADGSDPAWCFRAGCLAVVAAGKCLKLKGFESWEKEKALNDIDNYKERQTERPDY